MKKIIPLLLLAVFVANAAPQSGRRITRSPAQPEPPVQAPVWSQPDPAPPTSRAEAGVELAAVPESLLQRPLRSIDKGSFRLADFDGKVIVVNIWASWCGPCRSEVPEYEKVRKEYA